MPGQTQVNVFLFTDIEGSTRLWERAPEAMREALARHDDIAAECVVSHRGRIVKTTGDGIHAVFDDPLDAVNSAVAMQVALEGAGGDAIELRVRAGLHVGVDDERGNDFYGTAVNRAARIMSAAHGGQILVSDAVASLLRDRLPVDICLRPLGRVRLRDLREPEAVHQVDHPALRTEFPALRSLESTPNNLPHALTSFIGREKELADVRERLRTARLLTIFGIGGLGKSRLSLEVASASLDAFADGVWFVELAPVSDPRLVAQALATVLGIRDDAGESPHDAIMKFVRDKRVLVVLDNCEHVTQACAELARGMLESGAGVTILATSRERLGIGGEQTYPLAPFAVPPQVDLAPSALKAFPSVRLLTERALSARPDFAITSDNAHAVAAICQQLDGIPLALELAAARVRSMSVQRIAERLSDRFKLLSTGDRTSLPRQQTLRALIDWSYDLLSPLEQTLFGRLAVFAGGFTLEAAEDVAQGGDIAPADVDDLVAQLVEKSLVILDAEHERYRMLETVRQYAGELLDAEGSGATRTRHLEYYVALAESAQTELRGSTQGVWLARLDREVENIVAAHRHCDTAGDGTGLGLRLISSLMLYWTYRGKFEVGRRLTIEALARPATHAPDLPRCRALFRAGQFALFSGEYGEAVRYLLDSLEISRALEASAATSAVLAQLAVAAIRQGNPQAARDYLAESQALAKQLGDKRKLAVALNETGQLDRLEGDLAAARQNYEAALAIAKDIGDRESVAVALLNIAMLDLSSGALSSATSTLGDAHAIVLETGSRHTAQTLLEVAAVIAVMQQEWQSANRLFIAARRLSAETGLHVHPADEAFMAPALREARARIDDETWREAAAQPLEFGDAMRVVARLLYARSPEASDA